MMLHQVKKKLYLFSYHFLDPLIENTFWRMSRLPRLCSQVQQTAKNRHRGVTLSINGMRYKNRYRCGDTITGQMTMELRKTTLISSIILCLEGNLVTQWKEGNNVRHAKMSHYSDVVSIPLSCNFIRDSPLSCDVMEFNQPDICSCLKEANLPPFGISGVLSLAKPTVFKPGKHYFPITISIPDSIPPSLNFESNKIEYHFNAIIMERSPNSWNPFKQIVQIKKKLQILSDPHSISPQIKKHPILRRVWRTVGNNAIRLSAQIDRSSLVTKEKFLMTIRYHNDTPHWLGKVTCTLQQSSRSDGYRDRMLQAVAGETPTTIVQKFLSFSIPPTGAMLPNGEIKRSFSVDDNCIPEINDPSSLRSYTYRIVVSLTHAPSPLYPEQNLELVIPVQVFHPSEKALTQNTDALQSKLLEPISSSSNIATVLSPSFFVDHPIHMYKEKIENLRSIALNKDETGCAKGKNVSDTSSQHDKNTEEKEDKKRFDAYFQLHQLIKEREKLHSKYEKQQS